MVSWDVLRKYYQQVKRGDPFPLFSTAETTPGVLDPVLMFPVQETWTQWRESSEGLQWLRDWSISPTRKGLRAGAVQLEEEKAHQCVQVLEVMV